MMMEEVHMLEEFLKSIGIVFYEAFCCKNIMKNKSACCMIITIRSAVCRDC